MRTKIRGVVAHAWNRARARRAAVPATMAIQAPGLRCIALSLGLCVGAEMDGAGLGGGGGHPGGDRRFWGQCWAFEGTHAVLGAFPLELIPETLNLISRSPVVLCDLPAQP